MAETSDGTRHGRAVLCALVGAVMFGFLGIFTRYLHVDKGVASFDVATLRLLLATVALLLVLVIVERAELRVHPRDLPFFILFGVFKFLSDGTLFFAMGQINISLATLLQMTAPYYVMILSLFLFRERITAQRLIAVMMTFVGCMLVTGVLIGESRLDLLGVVSALLSGLFYALYLLGGRVGTRRGYHPVTLLFYYFLFGTVSAMLFTALTSDLPGTLVRLAEPDVLGAALFLGVGLTLIPYYLYAYATANASTTLVSMVSVVELVVATLVGYVFFDEVLSALNILGISLVLGSIVVADVHISRRVRERRAQDASTDQDGNGPD
ncbi:MAG: DMT family transporter [archaeon]|nr:DMT family transporter [archaeon]